MTGTQFNPADRHKTKSITHMLVWLGIASIVLLVGWAAIGRLDVVSIAPGQVVPASRVKQIQHLEGGIIREILVEEGQKVRQDQSLVVLAPTRSQSEVDELRSRAAALQVDLTRLEAEISGNKKPEFSDMLVKDQPDLVDKARALFAIRRSRLESDIAIQNQLVIQREKNLDEVRARIAKNRNVLSHIDEQISISKRLLAQDLTNRLKHLELLRQASNIGGDINIDKATLGRVQATIDETRARVVNIRTSFEEEARNDRDKASRSLTELRERLIKYKDSLERTVLRSPVEGVVKAIYIGTKGGVVKPGSTVLEIVPSADRLVIEAHLPIQDIGYVRAGNVAQIRLATPDAGLFGTLKGEVVRVSPDALVTDKGVPFYKIRIETERAFFERGEQKYQLYPGMQVQSSIQTGTRTVLDYILSPFIQSADQALHER